MSKKQKKVQPVVVRKPSKNTLDTQRIRFGSGFAPAKLAR